MGARPGDRMGNHHLIPEEVMKDTCFAKMFARLRGMGLEGDGAPNGTFLPGDKQLASQTGLPGHWTQHPVYSAEIENQVAALNRAVPGLSDTQLALGVRQIQTNAAESLMNGKYAVDPITGALK